MVTCGEGLPFVLGKGSIVRCSDDLSDQGQGHLAMLPFWQ